MFEKFNKLTNSILQSTLKAAHLDIVPTSIQSIILGLVMIQPISFIHQPSKIFKAADFNSNQFNYLSLIDYFTLPQFGNIMLFPLIFMLSFGVIPLFLLQFEMKQKQFFLNMFAIYIQISQYFNLPFACHCIRNLEDNFIISTITLIILSLFWSGIIFFHKETFTMKMDYFQVLNTSILDLLYHLSEVGLILNYQLLSNSFNSVVIQSMIVFGMGILQIGIVYSFQICNQIQLQITVILGGSTKIVLSILYFINNTQQNDCISLLIIPLIAFIILIIYTRYEDQLLYNLVNGTLNQIEYYFAKLINNQFTKQRQKLLFYATIIAKFSEIDFTIRQRISPMSEFIIDLYPKHMFKYFNMVLIGNILKMQDQIDASKYLHYIAILSNLKFYYPALQQVNILNMKIQKVKRGFIESSNVQSSHTSEYRPRKSITTSQQKSYNIVKDSNVLIFKQISDLSAIDRQKAFILKELVIKELSGEFQKMSDSSNLALGIQMFLSSESSNLNLKSELINLINQKVQFLRLLINPTKVSQMNLFTFAKAIARKMQHLEVKLYDLYQGFPSLRMKSVIQFYQGEIVYNHLEALKLKNSSSFSDERLVGLFKNVALTFLSNSIVYLHLGFQQDQLIFLNSSEKAHKFFRCRQDLFKPNNEVQFLLPEVVRQCHGMLIQRFLVSNKSKFYLSPNLAFFQINQIVVSPCKLYFNVDLSQDNLSFYSFFQEHPTSSAFILISENHKINGITTNFFEKINQDIRKYNDGLSFKNVSIEKLFNEYPSFPQDSVFETQLTIIKPNGNWEQYSQFLNFTVQLIIKECVNDFYIYTLIEIKDFEQKTDQTIFIDPIEINIDIEDISEIEAIVQKPNELVLENYQIQTSRQHICKPKIGILSPSISHLMSPHNNSNLINESSRIPKLQQDYFVAPHQDASLSLQKSKFLELNSNPPRNDQEEFNDQGSQCSSLIGIKTSLYFKKYDLMGKLLAPTYPNHLKLFIFFLIIQMILCSIYWLLTLTKKQTDLLKILNEIDMIQLHSGFMGPHDAFLAMRAAIVLYQQYVGMKILTLAQYSEKTQQIMANIAVGYDDMKATYESQQTNPNFVNFFTDQNLTVIFMKENATVVYSMVLNIRESMQILVSYFYQILRVFQNQQTLANKPFQVYQAANVFNFHYFLEEITTNIYRFSKNRSISISQQWTQIYVIFILLSFGFTLIFLYYYRLFHQIFDKYMYIFQSCDTIKISREIDRLKEIISQLQSEQDALFSYHFDLESKEKFLEQEIKVFQRERLKDYKELEPREPISILKKVLFYASLWIIFLITSTVVNQTTIQAMEKYSYTVDFYKLIQDMQFTSAPLYTYRDLRYLWGNFTYLTPLDLEREYLTLEQGKSNINKFTLFCQNFQPSLYQVQQSFIDFFQAIQQQSLCSVLTQEELGYLEYYCNITLDGNLNKGLIVSLNFIKSQIETEQSINNFTKRVIFNFYENEGGILLIRVFQIMTQKLKQSMTDDNQQQSNIQIGISIGYLVFLLLFMLLVSIWIYQSLLDEYLTTKRFIQILPIGCFFLDDQMDRTLRKLLQIK